VHFVGNVVKQLLIKHGMKNTK